MTETANVTIVRQERALVLAAIPNDTHPRQVVANCRGGIFIVFRRCTSRTKIIRGQKRKRLIKRRHKMKCASKVV